MRKYKDFQPTGFDPKGLNADSTGIGEYYVVLGRNRDSNVLAESNFAHALREIGGEDGEHVQVHRFGHWANGWFDLILVDDTKLEAAEEIQNAIEDYCVLDDADFSEREYKSAHEYWKHCGTRERIKWLERAEMSIFASRRDLGAIEDDNGRLYELLTRD